MLFPAWGRNLDSGAKQADRRGAVVGRLSRHFHRYPLARLLRRTTWGAVARLERDHETISGVLDALAGLWRWGAAGPCPTGILGAATVVGLVTSQAMEPFRGHEEWTAVSVAMAEPVTVTADTPATVVAGMLLAHAFNCVPIATQGILIGVVSRADLLRLLV
jgi:CBS domain-containing protein